MSSSPPDSLPTAGWQLVTLGRIALLDERGAEVEDLRGRPRKLALLAYLAIAGRAVPRAQLVELFWGDRDEERARASLSEALSHLRRTLGRDALPAYTSDAGLAPGFALTVDVLDLDAAARAGDHARVLALHRGPFLDGLHIPDAATFDRWVERQRGRAADRHAAACAAIARARLASGDHDDAARLAGHWLDHQWDSAEAATLLVRALAAPATPAAWRRALAAYRRHAQRLADEIGGTPTATLAAIARDLEARLLASGGEETTGAATDEPSAMGPVAPMVDEASARADVAPQPSPDPVCADDAFSLGAPASDVPMSTRAVVESVPHARTDDTARSGASVPTTRLHADADTTRAPQAAQRRLSLRTVVAASAALVLSALVFRPDDGHDAGAAALDDGSPSARYRRAAESRWTSAARDGEGALALLDSAIARDSTDAATYLLRHRIRRTMGRVTNLDELRVAVRHADRLPPRERLLATGELRLTEDDVRALAIADTLVTRYADDTEALLQAARIHLQALHLGAADSLARQVLRLAGDAGWARTGGACTSCEAIELRLHAAWARGDVGHGELLAGEYTARAGTTPRTLLWQATLAEGRGLWRAADSLYRRSGLAPHHDADTRRVRLAIRAGALAEAERIVRAWQAHPDPDRRVDARFALALVLREAGRAREGVESLAAMETTSYSQQLAYAALLLDAGEPRRAAAAFAAAETRWLGDGADPTSPFASRIRTWALAHAATAYAAAGDTARLLPLAARMDTLGRRALLGRVPALHHWPRALLWRARGERDSTIAALRRVLVSPTQAHLRAAWLLGHELVAAGQPAEARAVIERALMGPTEASGYYVTRTELHAVRAEACAALGDERCVAEEAARRRSVVARRPRSRRVIEPLVGDY